MSLRGTKQSHAIQSEQKGVELALAVVYGARLPSASQRIAMTYFFFLVFPGVCT
ncbi:hypothetical protein SAMN05216524_102120 [Mucilaginibacter sp. OK098]|nr:hypothetical protein SAMN05216524_102120 [Mucilaginibacter sp. OK098]